MSRALRPAPGTPAAPRRAAFLPALVEALIPADADDLGEAERSRVIAEVTEFVRSQTLALPPRLLRLLRSGLWGFRVATVVTHARPFGRLPLAVRRRWVAAWAYGRLTPARQLFRAPRSLVLLAYYESDPVRAHRARRENTAGPR